MGIFNGYLKEGPGVSKDTPEKHRFFLFFELFGRKITKLIQLNLILFVCLIPMAVGLFYSIKFNPNIIADNVLNMNVLKSEPIVHFSGDITGLIIYIASLFVAGPAIAGFTYVIRNFQREEHAWVFSDFKDHFKANFKQATALAFIDSVVYFVLYVAFVFYTYALPAHSTAITGFAPMLTAVIAVIAVVYTWMHYYIYVMMVTFDLSLKDMLKNALLFAIGKLPLNIFITAICLAIIGVSIYFNIVAGIIAAAVISLSLIGYIIIFSVYPTIDEYLIQPVSAESDDITADFSDSVED